MCSGMRGITETEDILHPVTELVSVMGVLLLESTQFEHQLCRKRVFNVSYSFIRKMLGHDLEISRIWLLPGLCLRTIPDHLPVSFNVV
jgi:hypothetical protein